jgi:hypothetical protein
MDTSIATIVVGVLRPGSEVPVVEAIPNDAESVRRLAGKFPDRRVLAACYEAGPGGYELHRLLTGGWPAAATTTGYGYGMCKAALTRQSARMLGVRARYLPLLIWSSPFHRSRTGRDFMLGDTSSDTEHSWGPATCRVTRCNNRA